MKIFLDARELAHPEPFTISVGHLQDMGLEDYFYMINSLKPLPLIDVAENNGFMTLSHEDKQGTWHILISKNSEHKLQDFLDV